MVEGALHITAVSLGAAAGSGMWMWASPVGLDGEDYGCVQGCDYLSRPCPVQGSEWQWAFVPDDAGGRVIAQPAVTSMRCLGAAPERCGDLGPGRALVDGSCDRQFSLDGELVELSSQLFDTLERGTRHHETVYDIVMAQSTSIDVRFLSILIDGPRLSACVDPTTADPSVDVPRRLDCR